MENKNTFPLNSNVETLLERYFLVPQVGDEFTFCKDEETALASYMRYRDDERNAPCEPIDEEYLTDIFKIQLIEGTMYNPIYIGGKKFGFFGCRLSPASWFHEGHFFLYEME